MIGMPFLLLQGTNRFRGRPHFAEFQELVFKLQTFGIPTDTLPVSIMKGNERESSNQPGASSWSIEWHLEWLEMQQHLEEEATKKAQEAPQSEDDDSADGNGKNAILVPQRFDVLFGKSKYAREHPGNLRCLCIVEMLFNEYEKADRRQKTQVADMVMTRIRESKGRFLKKQGPVWVEVDHGVAREKISHFFRALRGQKMAAGRAGSPTTTAATAASKKRSPVTEANSVVASKGRREQ